MLFFIIAFATMFPPPDDPIYKSSVMKIGSKFYLLNIPWKSRIKIHSPELEINYILCINVFTTKSKATYRY